jgi:hypothetical protein
VSRVTRRIAVPLIAVAVLALPAVAFASRVIATKSGQGDHAVAIAGGTAKKPKALYVKITTTPAQHATGNWTLVCSRGTSAGSKSGDFSGRGTFQRTVKLPIKHPNTCTVSAAGSLDGSGRIRVTLLAG